KFDDGELELVKIFNELDRDVCPSEGSDSGETTFAGDEHPILRDDDGVDQAGAVDGLGQFVDADKFPTLALVAVDDDGGNREGPEVTAYHLRGPLCAEDR